MKPGDCKHFNGIQHEVCPKGVAYDSVRDASGPGMVQHPCLKLPGYRPATTTCPYFEALSDDEYAKQKAEMVAVIAAALGGKCPECGAVCERRDSARTTMWECPTHGFVMRGCRRIGEP